MALCGSSFAFAKYAERSSPRLYHLIQNHFVCSPQNLRLRRYHTLLTASFMHFSPSHLALNMMTLFCIGPLIVSSLGAGSFLALWAGGALGCSGASLTYAKYLDRRFSAFETRDQNLYDRIIGRSSFSPPQHSMSEFGGRSVGASGSLCGMLVPVAVTNPHGQWRFFPIPIEMQTHQMVEVAAAGSAACLALGLLPGIGHAGHLGGMAAGAGYAYYKLNWRPRVMARR
ncbi:MAG: hypothetical protein Q9182_005906 [Xanthomendoza sp. 2 TL-2023]